MEQTSYGRRNCVIGMKKAGDADPSRKGKGELMAMKKGLVARPLNFVWLFGLFHQSLEDDNQGYHHNSAQENVGFLLPYVPFYTNK